MCISERRNGEPFSTLHMDNIIMACITGRRDSANLAVAAENRCTHTSGIMANHRAGKNVADPSRRIPPDVRAS
jgi:hypothetical protein